MAQAVQNTAPHRGDAGIGDELRRTRSGEPARFGPCRLHRETADVADIDNDENYCGDSKQADDKKSNPLLSGASLRSRKAKGP